MAELSYREIVAIAESVQRRQPFSYVVAATQLAEFILRNIPPEIKSAGLPGREGGQPGEPR